MKISIYNIISSKLALFHDEGLRVYSEIENLLDENKKVELSFENIESCSTQFLNASIGNAYVNFENVDSLMEFVDFDHLPFFMQKVNDVRENAKHSKEYDANFEEAIA